MTSTVLWTLPVPSTALLDIGPILQIRLRRELALQFSYEAEDDSRQHRALVFERVEAFKCTYYRAGDASMRAAYDTLVDRGSTAWLQETRANLEVSGGQAQGLMHLMVGFDDGPTYEVLCRSFRVDEE